MEESQNIPSWGLWSDLERLRLCTLSTAIHKKKKQKTILQSIGASPIPMRGEEDFIRRSMAVIVSHIDNDIPFRNLDSPSYLYAISEWVRV